MNIAADMSVPTSDIPYPLERQSSGPSRVAKPLDTSARGFGYIPVSIYCFTSQLLPIPKQNIPKDYNITVRYLPKEVSGMCWVKLNIFHLEKSLDLLANKFGNISSNKDNIGTLVQMLREMRYYIGDDLEDDMFNFECHYRKVEWLTGRYFKFVEDFFNTANSSQEDGECDPPPCPTTIKTTPTISVSTQHHSKGTQRDFKMNCILLVLNGTVLQRKVRHYLKLKVELHLGDTVRLNTGMHPFVCTGTRNQIFLPDTLERGLLALLFIPLIAVGFLLIWKVKSRRTPSPLQRDMDGPPLFIGVEASAPPLDDEMSEKQEWESAQDLSHRKPFPAVAEKALTPRWGAQADKPAPWRL
ncbi:hypothetical protein P4O66_020569 [Electrophorus voltai]|uniref:Kit ligand n=1 Tax=Electrophorus voltai TaxID=2609070 RepID=A0AAD8ZUK1_9TELE|nr:hypothetical protein P4O66_020569 [Electrophorus voltai]